MSWKVGTIGQTDLTDIQLLLSNGRLPAWILVAGSLGGGYLVPRVVSFPEFPEGGQAISVTDPSDGTHNGIILSSVGVIQFASKLAYHDLKSMEIYRAYLDPIGMTGQNFSVWYK